VADEPELHDWKPLVEDLRGRRERAYAMGGAELVGRQRAAGKWPVRERIDTLLDPGSFVEYGSLADSMDPQLQAERGYLAADGMVAGIGQIDGRRVAVMAYDFTVMAGSMGGVGEHKTARMRELAQRQRIPMIWLLDSAGARIQQSSGSTFAQAGALFREQVTLSGVVPRWPPCSATARPAPPTSLRWPTSSRWSRGPPRWRWPDVTSSRRRPRRT